MSLRDECDCQFPAVEGPFAAAAGVGWTCQGCGAEYEYEGGGDWRCLFGGTPGAEWSGRLVDLSDAALLTLADAVTRERARRSGP